MIQLPDNPTMLDRILYRFELAAATVVGEDAVAVEPVGDPQAERALEIYDSGDVLIESGTGYTRRRLTLTVEGYVFRADGAVATAERAKLHADTVRAIMVDETLDGLVEVIEPGDRRTGTLTLAERRTLMFAQDFAIDFATDRYDPALPA